jgi:hypothetical protein
MAVVENSHVPININKSCAQKHTALATPSSINCTTCYNQRSAASTKKLLKQAIATVSMAIMTPISGLPPFIPCIMGGEEPITGHGSDNECEEADVNPAEYLSE